MNHRLVAALRLLDAAPDVPRLRSYVRQERPVARHGDRFAALPDGLQAFETAIGELRASYGASVGLLRVDLGEGPIPIATAWPCGPRRMITAGHVLKAFLPPGRSLNHPTRFPAGGVPVDARPAPGDPPMRAGSVLMQDGQELPVLRWVCAGERDLVVFEAEHGSELIGPPARADAGGLCILGYPLQNPSERFPDDYIGSAFCSLGFRLNPNGAADGYFWHDATTEPGYSGSPVFDLASKALTGLHVWGSHFPAREGSTPAERNRDWNDAVDLDAARGADWLARAMDGDEPAAPANARCVTWTGMAGLTRSGVHESVAPDFPPPPRIPTPSIYAGVVPDRPDGRDRPYVLAPGLPVDEKLPDPDPVIGFQDGEGSCAAFALAAAIELQLGEGRRRRGGSTFSASVRMLDRMARRHDEWIDDSKDGTSLRAVLKGFYHNGVCAGDLAPYSPGDARFLMTRGLAKSAREITLGGYYSVAESITDVQAAVQQAGAVLMSGHIHKGWQAPRKGVIRFDPARPPRRIGAHAFVVTGYVDDGFVVQNSWGPAWGGWRDWRGHAVWTYEDWAQNVIDAWVIRLAPLTRQAFGVTAQGRSGDLAEPRRSNLIGHVAHSERDGLVEDGTLGMGMAAIGETARYLATSSEGAEKYQAMAVVYHDPLLGAGTVERLAFHLTRRMKARRLYPFHVVHGLDEMATLRLRLLHEAGVIAERFRERQDDRDAYLERATGGIARRLTDAYAEGARAAAQGELRDGLALLAAAAAASDRPVALVSAGIGVLTAMACREAMPELASGPHLAVASPVEAAGAVHWRLGRRRASGEIPGYRGDWPDLMAVPPHVARATEGREATLVELLARRDVSAEVLRMLNAAAGRHPGRRRPG